MTNPDPQPDKPTVPAAAAPDETQETVSHKNVSHKNVANENVRNESVGHETGAAAPVPAPASALWRRRPTSKQALALAGAFLAGACLCGGVGVAVSAAVFHHGSDHGWRSSADDRDGGDGRGRGDHGDRKPGDKRSGQASAIPVTPPAPATSTPTVTATATVSPS